MSTVSIITLGCARNEVDSDQTIALLNRRGYTLVDDPEAADAVVVNTCTFIDAATQESVDTVLGACDLKSTAGARAVVVIGCMAERYGLELADAVPEADTIIGFGGYPRLPDILDELLAGGEVPRFVGAPEPTSTPTVADASGSRSRSLPLVAFKPTPPTPGVSATPRIAPADAATPQDDLDRIPATGPRFPVRTAPGRPWAYLKIASGCDRACTFCAIPSWRGDFRSRPQDELVAEAAWLAEHGARELVLVSENTTSWGKDLPDGRSVQPRLLEELVALDGVERIRLAYLQPDELRPALIEAIAEIDGVASYYDLSLQHASAPVLRRMARSGGRRRFTDLIAQIRSLDPEAVFRSNFIVGFPGETDEDVEELAGFLAEARLDWVGVFAFSPQEGTSAPDLPDQVSPELAQQRLRELVDLQELVAEHAASRFIGRRLDVIVEECGDDGAMGRSYREAPETDGEIRLVVGEEGRWTPLTLPAGRVVTVEVVASDGVDLLAVPDLPPSESERQPAGLAAGSGAA
jgi:ribosomal protein S12 methylthiotransferase